MSTILIGFKPGVLTDAQLDLVGQAAPGMRVVVTSDRDEMAAVLDDVEIAAAMVPDSPLWDLRNVVITGHYGGASPAYDDRAF
jgi:hypothetical protein